VVIIKKPLWFFGVVIVKITTVVTLTNHHCGYLGWLFSNNQVVIAANNHCGYLWWLFEYNHMITTHGYYHHGYFVITTVITTWLSQTISH